MVIVGKRNFGVLTISTLVNKIVQSKGAALVKMHFTVMKKQNASHAFPVLKLEVATLDNLLIHSARELPTACWNNIFHMTTKIIFI